MLNPWASSVLFFAALVVGLGGLARADTLVVPSDYPTIQAAMDAAQAGDTVLVLDGTYTGPGNRDLTFSGKPITVQSANGPAACVIDCERVGRAFRFEAEGPLSIVRGLTLTRGVPVGVGAIGGAVYCRSVSRPTFIGCLFTENHASSIACEDSSRPTFVDCVISKGHGTSYGAGLSLEDLASATILNCTFSENESSYIGGAIWWGSESTGTILNSTFVDNSAFWGGGIAFFQSEVTIGGCTFSGNFAADRGGGIVCLGSSNWGNTTHVEIENTIFWNDSATVAGPEISVLSTKFGYGAAVVDYSDVEGGEAAVEVSSGSLLFWGFGNLDLDPLFVDPIGGDYHLAPYSPCINAGDPGFVPQPGEVDIDGEQRVFAAGLIDIGSDEFHPFRAAR